MRVDIVIGELQQPTRGVCTNQQLSVTGDVIRTNQSALPELCGNLSNNHCELQFSADYCFLRLFKNMFNYVCIYTNDLIHNNIES